MERKDGKPKEYTKSAKTRDKIVKALMELLDSRPLDSVTIQDICDKAEIHRTTFYKHYGSIFDVIDEMSSEITKALSDVLDVLEYRDVWFDFLADYIEKYKRPLRNLNKTKYKEMVVSPLAVVLYEFYSRLFRLEKKEIPEGVKKEWLIRYHVAGALALVEHWLDSDASIEQFRKGIEGMYHMIFM